MGTTPGDLAALQAATAEADALAADLAVQAANVVALNGQVLALIAWVLAEHPGATVTRLIRDPYIGIKLPTFVQQTTSVVVSPASATTSGAGATQQFTAVAYDQETPPQPMSPQPTFNWATSNTGIATINAATGLATSTGPGTCTVTATISVGGGLGIHGSGALTVNAAFNEPVGMTVVIDTGPIINPTSQLQSASCTLSNGTVSTTLSNFSPTTKSSTGEWNQNLVASPSGSGLRLIYDGTLSGGFSPVRFGFSAFASRGTGYLYSRRTVLFSSNWNNSPVATGTKMGEPHTTAQGSGAGATENHIDDATYDLTGNGTIMQPMVVLQGPNNQSRNLLPSSSGVGIITGGAKHVVENLFTPETTPGAGNGQYQCWVDGVLTANYSNVNWIASGQTAGWVDYLVDPVWGGTGGSPAQNQYWELDKIHISVK